MNVSLKKILLKENIITQFIPLNDLKGKSQGKSRGTHVDDLGNMYEAGARN